MIKSRGYLGGILGALVGAIVGFLLRPSFPDAIVGGSAPDKPSLLMMIQSGFSSTRPTERTASVYLILGVVVGGLLGMLLVYLTSRRRSHES